MRLLPPALALLLSAAEAAPIATGSPDQNAPLLLPLAQPLAEPLGEPLQPSTAGWQAVATVGSPHGRDEAGYYEWECQMCMFGGRFTQPIDCYDPNTKKWTRSKTTTNNLHHIQPVVYCLEQGGKRTCEVYVVASWHGNWPDTERNTDHVVIYNPTTDTLRNGSAIPEQFQRGAAGVVVHDDLLYVINGACNGHLHQFGAKAYRGLSTYDPRTGVWKQVSFYTNEMKTLQWKMIENERAYDNISDQYKHRSLIEHEDPSIENR